jgi:hypothetical protein
VFDAFEIERTARRAAYAAKKEADKLSTAAATTDTETESTAIKAAESVVVEAQ